LNNSEWPKFSLFAVARHIAEAYTSESGLRLYDYLSFYGIALYYPARVAHPSPERPIRVRRVQDNYRFPLPPDHQERQDEHPINKKERQDEHPINRGFRTVCAYLVEFILAVSEKRQQPEELMTPPPKWLEPKVFLGRSQQLIELLLLSLVTVDYVFSFNRRNKADELIPFCEKAFFQLKSLTAHWRFLNFMLQVIPNEEAMTTHAALLKACLAKPFKTYTTFAAIQSIVGTTETYRDNLVLKIRHAIQKKTTVFWKGETSEKDMLIIRWKLLTLSFMQPNGKGVLSLIGRPKEEELDEESRPSDSIGSDNNEHESSHDELDLGSDNENEQSLYESSHDELDLGSDNENEQSLYESSHDELDLGSDNENEHSLYNSDEASGFYDDGSDINKHESSHDELDLGSDNENEQSFYNSSDEASGFCNIDASFEDNFRPNPNLPLETQKLIKELAFVTKNQSKELVRLGNSIATMFNMLFNGVDPATNETSIYSFFAALYMPLESKTPTSSKPSLKHSLTL
jgi:hypothetical protein